MIKAHTYSAVIEWTGNLGQGTRNYKAYSRSHTVKVKGKSAILCSSDSAFMGDPERHNPEELLLASISSCHMLWYLHLCSEEGIIVKAYTDKPTGIMLETADGGGHFSEVTLHPQVVLADGDLKDLADTLHQKANKLCFIANSCNFPVHHEASYTINED